MGAFFGIVFDDARITVSGSQPATLPRGPHDDGNGFIYAEPVESTTMQGAQTHAKDLLATDENARLEAPAPGTHTLEANNGRWSGRHAAAQWSR